MAVMIYVKSNENGIIIQPKHELSTPLCTIRPLGHIFINFCGSQDIEKKQLFPQIQLE